MFSFVVFVFECFYGPECSSTSLYSSNAPCMFYCFCGKSNGGTGVRQEEM